MEKSKSDPVSKKSGNEELIIILYGKILDSHVVRTSIIGLRLVCAMLPRFIIAGW